MQALRPTTYQEQTLSRRGAGQVLSAEDGALRGVLSEHSRRAYKSDFADFAAYLHPDVQAASITSDDIRALTVDDIAAYRDELRQRRKLATATVNRRLAAIRKLMQAAVDRGIRPDNPAKAVKGYKGSSKETPGLTLEEARRLVAAVDRSSLLGLRDYALLQVLLRLGLRREEACGLRTSDFRRARGRLIADVRGKGDKIRPVVLPPDVHAHLNEWLESAGVSWEVDAPLFIELQRRGRGASMAYTMPTPDRPISVNGLWTIVRRYAKAARLESDITPHSMRATFITLALEAGAPLQKVQYQAGHVDPRTTERYDRSRQAIENPASDFVPVL